MRNAYLDTLYQLAKEDKNVLAVVADNGAIVYDGFRADFPEQYINFGISEAHMVAACAGLASCGKIPFAYTISGFITMRAFEQVRNDVCMQKQNVKLVGIGAGLVYSSLGPTHHATEDLALMRVLPGLTIFSPSSPKEAQAITRAAYEINGPVYIRLGTTKEKELYAEDYEFEPGRAVTLRFGTDICFVATGSIVGDVLEAARELEKLGFSARVLNIHTIKPLDNDAVIQAANETRAIITVEEHNVNGGLGGAVAEALLEGGGALCRFSRMGLRDSFTKGYGSHAQVKEQNNLSVEHIIDRALQVIEDKRGL